MKSDGRIACQVRPQWPRVRGGAADRRRGGGGARDPRRAGRRADHGGDRRRGHRPGPVADRRPLAARRDHDRPRAPGDRDLDADARAAARGADGSRGAAPATACCSPPRRASSTCSRCGWSATCCARRAARSSCSGPTCPPRRSPTPPCGTRRTSICLSSTVPGGTDSTLITIHEIQRQFPTAGFVIGGRAITSRLRSRPGIGVCEQVSDAVEAVDAVAKQAEFN